MVSRLVRVVIGLCAASSACSTSPPSQPTAPPREFSIPNPTPVTAALERQAPARFVTATRDAQLLFAPGEIALTLQNGTSARHLRWRPQGASSVEPTPLAQLPGRVHAPGSRPAESGAAFAGIAYPSLWPGVRLEVASSREAFTYRFVLEAGSDAGAIELSWEGADRLTVTDAGRALAIGIGARTLTESGLRCFEHGSAVVEVGCSFWTRGNRYGFSVERLDRGAVLVIDPVVTWGRFVGGNLPDGSRGVAADSAGNVYLVGNTLSSNYPTTAGVFDTTFGGAGLDAVITKISPDGGLVWSTYLGGTAMDVAYGVAVDSAQSVYVVGETVSTDFPVVNAYDATTTGAATDAFVTKISAAGDALLWSTYLGGAAHDSGRAIAVDSAGAAYVTGYSGGAFPTLGGFKSVAQGDEAFVTKFDAAGALVYSSLLGGFSNELGSGIAVDGAGRAHVVGYVILSTDFPSNGGFDTTLGGNKDGFVTKVAADGASIEWSTFLGGSGSADDAFAVAVDSSGNVVVGGFTDSTDFPSTNGFATTLTGASDGFVTSIASSGALNWSTYLGGTFGASEQVLAIGVDDVGNVYAAGTTQAPDFPTLAPFQSALAGGVDAFVTRIDASGPSIVWSSFLGGAAGDEAHGLAVTGLDALYVSGLTASPNFPHSGGFGAALAGSDDAFVVRVSVPAANGDSCQFATDCTSGICEDGICCVTACGTCASCDATGTSCTVTPPDDGACGSIACSGLDTACRSYAALEANRCDTLGVCRAPDSAACVTFTELAGSCDDADACTTGDSCSAGNCVGTAVTCDDSDACTTDTCNAGSGCVFTPIAGCGEPDAAADAMADAAADATMEAASDATMEAAADATMEAAADAGGPADAATEPDATGGATPAKKKRDGGCGCRTVPATGGPSAGLGWALLAGALLRRRRRWSGSRQGCEG